MSEQKKKLVEAITPINEDFTQWYTDVCLKAELVVTDRGWALRDKFLAALRAKLRALPPRVAYYPGSHEKHAAFLAKFPAAERLGTPGGSGVEADGDRPEVKPTAWLLQAGLSPDEVRPACETLLGRVLPLNSLLFLGIRTWSRPAPCHRQARRTRTGAESSR